MRITIGPVLSCDVDLVVSGAVVLLLFVVGALLVRLIAARRSENRDRLHREHERLDLELSLAEQTSRLTTVRELQDVAIRSVSELLRQIEGARHSIDSEPASASRALSRAAESGRSVLADLRRVAKIAREGEDVETPARELESVVELFALMEGSGLSIAFDETGEPLELRPGAEIAVYRILQRSLSNSLRHGGPGTEARVAFQWSSTGLHLRIDDDGVRASAERLDGARVKLNDRVVDDARALAESSAGVGLLDMRERAELFGGSLNAHRVPGVGFSIEAFFPTRRHHDGVDLR